MTKITKKVEKKTTKKAKRNDIITEKLAKELDAILLGKTKDTELGYVLFRIEHDPKKDQIVRAGSLIREMNGAQIMTVIASLIEILQDKGIPKEMVLMAMVSGGVLK